MIGTANAGILERDILHMHPLLEWCYYIQMDSSQWVNWNNLFCPKVSFIIGIEVVTFFFHVQLILVICAYSQVSILAAISFRQLVFFIFSPDYYGCSDLHTKVYFYSASSLKQLSTGRYVTSLGRQSVFVHTPQYAYLLAKHKIQILKSFDWPERARHYTTELGFLLIENNLQRSIVIA